MVRRLLALVLLVNAVAVVPNLPRILSAVDGELVGAEVGGWSAALGIAAGDLVEDIAAGAPHEQRLAEIEAELRADPLEDPLDDPALAELARIWRALDGAGRAVEADRLAELLGLDEAELERLAEP